MKIAIYGINKCLQTFYSLLKDRVYVSAICVKDGETPYSVLGKPTIKYSEIKKYPNDWKVILSPNDKAQDELKLMRNDGVNATIFSGDLEKRLIIDDILLDSLSVCFFLHTNINRDVYIYGIDNRAKCFAEVLKLLDFEIKAFISNEKEFDDEINNIPVVSVYQLWMNYDNLMIVISKPTSGIVKFLNDMGFQYGKNYCLLSSLRINERRGNRQAVWDLTLGHTYLDDAAETYGFVKYGKDEAEKRIVILGGSTTDSQYTWFNSWAQILYNNLTSEGYNIQVINGAMCGYNVQQEFFKLVRDVIDLNPDLVIDFSGTNNVGTARVSPETPFVPYYLKNMANILEEKIVRYTKQTEDMNALSDHSNDVIFMGNPTNNSCALSYMNTLRMMKAICEEFKIKFISFLQPNLWTKRNYWDEWEKSIVFCSSVSNLKGDGTDFRVSRAVNFIDEIKKSLLSFQVDITSLFDNESDVYMDTDHYTLKGNEKIAKCVEKNLKNLDLI